MQLSCTGVCSQSAIIGHEEQYSVVGEVVFVQIVHQVAEAFVHAFNQGGIRCFYRGKSFVQIFLVETHVGLDRRMDGIMGHVEEERLVRCPGVVQSFLGFYGKGFGEEYVFAVIFFQSGYGSQRAFSAGFVSEVLHAVVAGGRACRMTGYVHVKTHFQRIGSGRVISSEVGFAAMNGVVTVVLEHLCQRGDLRGAFHTRFLTDTVDIPFGVYHNGVRLFVGGILA